MKPVRAIRRPLSPLHAACIVLTVLLLAGPPLAGAGTFAGGCVDCACRMMPHGDGAAGGVHHGWRAAHCCADAASPCRLSAAASSDILPAALHTALQPPLPHTALMPGGDAADRHTPSNRRIAVWNHGAPRGAPARYLDICRLVI